MNDTKHSPTPWVQIAAPRKDWWFDLWGSDHTFIGSIAMRVMEADKGCISATTDATHIILCVNSHAALVEALRASGTYQERCEAYPEEDGTCFSCLARAALALAKGEGS